MQPRPKKGDTTEWDYIGREFIDVEDNYTFIITEVCMFNGNLVYEHYLVGGDPSDLEHSGCEELLNEEWSKWLAISSSSVASSTSKRLKK